MRTRLALGCFWTAESVHCWPFWKKLLPATNCVCCEYSTSRSLLLSAGEDAGAHLGLEQAAQQRRDLLRRD